MTLTLAAPAAAADPAPLKKATTRLNLAGATSSPLVAAPAARAFALQGAATTPAADTTSDARPFFKTKTGVAAIALMVAGGVFTLYSVGHDSDPVHSPIR